MHFQLDDIAATSSIAILCEREMEKREREKKKVFSINECTT